MISYPRVSIYQFTTVLSSFGWLEGRALFPSGFSGIFPKVGTIINVSPLVVLLAKSGYYMSTHPICKNTYFEVLQIYLKSIAKRKSTPRIYHYFYRNI